MAVNDPVHALLHKMLDEAERPQRSMVVAALGEEIRALRVTRQEAFQLLAAVQASLEENGQYTHGDLYFVFEGIEDTQTALKEMYREEDPE